MEPSRNGIRRPLTADGPSRHYIPVAYSFPPSLPPPSPPSPGRAGDPAWKKCYRPASFPATIARCTEWQKHPLNIGVYGPPRGKGARAKPLTMLIRPFIHHRSLFTRLPRFLLLVRAEPPWRFLFLDQWRARGYARTSGPLLSSLRLFCRTVSLISLSSFSRQLVPRPIFRFPPRRVRCAHRRTRRVRSFRFCLFSRAAIKATAGKSIVLRRF